MVGKTAPLSGLIVMMGLGLSACGITPYGGPDSVIATGQDRGFLDRGTLKNGEAAIAYDPDGCQNWLIDDGIEGYSSPRFDPVSGLPICNNRYPPGTVIGAYETESAALGDWVPKR
ncbi:hypothetical protein GU927_005970 [Rhodobacteraceae bacterium HSP-20]|uniref:Lipoprotein n=1 Tax=Paragemmobacter amnigenus TaxID=2852097 RepID=A0ABS6J4L0_9RHOB|nr:hypothetical protein [Rhodobacter amnigenus]MBU9697392.1 hypothetical protein [Rhodobacter amnigenus]MBV4388619.1 hypothetical protein [Rhodobacter amnigenus]